MTVQIIKRDGKPEYAVVPYEQWLRLQELAEAAHDIQAAREALRELETGEDEYIPSSVVVRLTEGEPPLRVWREFRGLTQTQLAEKAGVTQGAIAQIESGKRKGSIEMLQRLAHALNVDLEDLLWASDEDSVSA